MCRMIAMIFLLALSAEAAAGPMLPPADSYGFDWLHPKSAKCIAVTDGLAKRFRHCKHRTAGGFDGVTESYACRVRAKVEYLVFADKKTCESQLEMMEANAP